LRVSIAAKPDAGGSLSFGKNWMIVLLPAVETESASDVITNPVPSVISRTAVVPTVPRPSNRDAADTACILAYVTALAAMVAANDPVPLPVTSPVSVIVWLPVFVPLTAAVPVTVKAPLPPFVKAIPFTLVGVMAPSVKLSAGVVVPLVTVAETPFAVVTDTLVTVPVFVV
jgi:hypothetical protein